MSAEMPTVPRRDFRDTGNAPVKSDPRPKAVVSSVTENSRFTSSIAPVALAVVAVVVGLFVPFIGLPIAMIGMVAVVAADIKQPRARVITIALVVVAIAVNLALVMVALPATAKLVNALL